MFSQTFICQIISWRLILSVRLPGSRTYPPPSQFLPPGPLNSSINHERIFKTTSYIYIFCICVAKTWACVMWGALRADMCTVLIYTESPTHTPCSTVLLLGGSCGSCRTLRAVEDVTEEERDEPPWRWPLKQSNTRVRQTEEITSQKMNEEMVGWKKDVDMLWSRLYTAPLVTGWHSVIFDKTRRSTVTEEKQGPSVTGLKEWKSVVTAHSQS